MEKRIELEKRGLKPEKVTDLNLDNARSTTIVGLSSDLINLRRLSLNSVGLTSLKGFPKLPKLERLELSDNRISGGLQAFLEAPMLTHLNLSNNRIEDLDTVKPLAELKHLRVLDLFNCGVTSVEGYREKMFAMLPNLKYLDGYDIQENEASSDEGEEDDDDDEADEEEEVGDEDEEDEPEGADEEDEEEDVGLEYLEKEDIDEDDEADYEPGDKEGSSAAAGDDDDDDEEGSSDQPAKKKKKSE